MIKKALILIKDVYYILEKDQRQYLLLMIALMQIGSALEIAAVASISPLINVISYPGVVENRPAYVVIGKLFNLENALEYVYFFIIALVLLYLIKGAFILFERWFQMRFIYSCRRKMSIRLLEYYLREDYISYVSRDSMETYRDITTDVPQAFNVMTALVHLFMEVITCIYICAYLFVRDWVMTVIIAVFLIFLAGSLMRFLKNVSLKNGRSFRKHLTIQNKSVWQAIKAFKEIRISNKESYFIEAYKSNYAKLNAVQMRQGMYETLPRPLMETICICGLLITVMIRIAMGAELNSLTAMLSVFVLAAFRMIPSFNRITSNFSSVLYGKESLNHIRDLVKIMRDISYNDTDIATRLNVQQPLVLKNVSYHYPDNDKAGVSCVDLTVKPKMSVGIIGASGAGKTTLANIIMTLIEPQEGEVRLGEENIFRKPVSWRNTIGYVPQEIILLNDTIKRNVAFGLNDESIDEKKIMESLREAHVLEYVNSLPDGVDTIVGENGIKLSGGQRQRIGIARALYKEPDFLVLDEATSALDNETEEAVMKEIEALHGKITMLIIAHRVSTLKRCDEIFEITNETIVQRDKESVIG